MGLSDLGFSKVPVLWKISQSETTADIFLIVFLSVGFNICPNRVMLSTSEDYHNTQSLKIW